MKKTQQHSIIRKLFSARTMLILISGVFLFCPSVFSQDIPKSPNHYEIGVLVEETKEDAIRQWMPLAEYLSDNISDAYFSIVPLNYDEMDVAVETDKIDFVIANPLIFIEMSYFDDVQRIASIKREVNGTAHKMYGGVIFTRADRKDISDVNSLKGKSIGAVHQRAFAGWILAAREFQILGWNLDKDFRSVFFLGSSLSVINAVLDKRVDAGVIRSGILESLAQEGRISLDDIKVLRLREHNVNPHFLHSTDLFPEWSLGRRPRVPDKIFHQVVRLLFDLPEGAPVLKASGCAQWVLPYNYSSVRKVLHQLQKELIQLSGPRAFRLLVRDYWEMFLLVFVALCYMIFTTSRRTLLNRTLMRSRDILQKELVEHKRAEESLIESQAMLQNIMDLIPVRVFWKDKNSVFLGCNKMFVEDAGFDSPTNIIGKTDYDMIWKDQADMYRADDKRVMEAGNPLLDIIEPQAHGDRNTAWLRTHKIPMRNAAGEIVGILGTYEDITQSKKAQEALAKSEAKYRELVEGVNSLILRLDSDGNIIFINEFAQEFFGFTEEEILGRSVLDTIIPEQDDQGGDLTAAVKNVINEMISGKEEKYHLNENENIKRNGERVWISWSNTVIINDKEEKEILAVGHDITDRRKMEGELLRLSYAMEQSQNSVIITDKQGGIQYVNPQFSEVTGYAREEVIGKTPRILKSGDLPNKVYKELWETIESGETWRGEFHNRKKNGELFWERATISPVKDRFGVVVSYLAVKEDVTQEKKLAQDLQKAFGRLKEMERIINLSNAIVFMWSPQESDSSVKFVSDNIRLLGYEPEDFYIRGMKIRDFILDDDRGMVAETVKRNIRARRLEFSHQYRVKTQDNKIRWFEDHSFVTYAKNGEPEYIQGVAFDITDRRIAEERILEAVNMKSEFISIVSHELRTPLTAVKESINIVMEEEAGELNNVQCKFLGIAKRNVDRLGALINDVLDYQKLDMGKLKFEQQELDIRPLVEEVFKTMSLVAKNKGLEIKLNMPEGDRRKVFIDPNRIIQVLNNLTNNAIKFTEQGEVIIEVVYRDNGVQVLIRDTGGGIKAQDMHKLFQTFSQIKSGSERRSGETGLGLAISKKIIDSHGGAIWAESVFGKGSLFTFTVPFAE